MILVMMRVMNIDTDENGDDLEDDDDRDGKDVDDNDDDSGNCDNKHLTAINKS